ncbi:hypothetical protein EUX98_g1342 [Antrodiella citrinella]|uniref:BTB domain-containing protein n=1 Tax=Antrodiella citrinella TaxID=2447956 RepID=A0A4S4N1T2_9APHY|nr:hypothetical protein EUX98_g1342 [Antrodiella citrinella]
MNGSPSPSKVRHEGYYMDDTFTIFLVENELFKVHRYYLDRESKYFREWQMIPRDIGMERIAPPNEGQVDDHPVWLPGVTAKEFEALLDYFYKGQVTLHSKPWILDLMSNSTRIDADVPWETLLAISTRLSFPNVRTEASRLEEYEMTPQHRLCLAHDYDVPGWRQLAYEELSVSPRSLEVEEAEKLGFATAMRIAKAREACLRLNPVPTYPDERVRLIVEAALKPASRAV